MVCTELLFGIKGKFCKWTTKVCAALQIHIIVNSILENGWDAQLYSFLPPMLSVFPDRNTQPRLTKNC